MSTIAGVALGLDAVFGTAGDVVSQRIQQAENNSTMVTLADELLGTKVQPISKQMASATELVAAIAADPGITQVSQLVALAGIGTRTLQRTFHEYVGASPKSATKVHRLNDVLRQIESSPTPNYAALAAELGYSDQTHFTREFTTMVGVSPARYSCTYESGRRFPPTT